MTVSTATTEGLPSATENPMYTAAMSESASACTVAGFSHQKASGEAAWRTPNASPHNTGVPTEVGRSRPPAYLRTLVIPCMLARQRNAAWELQHAAPCRTRSVRPHPCHISSSAGVLMSTPNHEEDG